MRVWDVQHRASNPKIKAIFLCVLYHPNHDEPRITCILLAAAAKAFPNRVFITEGLARHLLTDDGDRQRSGAILVGDHAPVQKSETESFGVSCADVAQGGNWHIGAIARRMAFHGEHSVGREVLHRQESSYPGRFDPRQCTHAIQNSIEKSHLLALLRVFGDRKGQLQRQQVFRPKTQIKPREAVEALGEKRAAKGQRHSNGDLRYNQSAQPTATRCDAGRALFALPQHCRQIAELHKLQRRQ